MLQQRKWFQLIIFLGLQFIQFRTKENETMFDILSIIISHIMKNTFHDSNQ